MRADPAPAGADDRTGREPRFRADGVQCRRGRRSAAAFGDGRDRRGHLLDLADPSRVAGVVPMGAWAPRGRPRKRAGCWSVMMSIKSWVAWPGRSEEHTSELQSLMRISYAVFCLKKKNKNRRMTYKDYK